MHKSRPLDRSTPYPITSLPMHEQLFFSTSVCLEIFLSMNFPYSVISYTFVLLGSYPESWPLLFNAPFTASSLADFWTRRWHGIYQHVFDHLSTAILCVIPVSLSSPPSLPKRIIRSVIIFGLSALFHVIVMYRLDMMQTEHLRTFMDPSILSFFLLQPLSLALEVFVISPACDAFIPPIWRNTVSQVWVWAFLLWLGRFWSDVWVYRGLWDEKWSVVRWSVVRGLLGRKWVV